MPAFAKITPEKIDIKKIIQNSHLNEEIKNKFFDVLPSLNKEQLNKIYNFIQKNESKISLFEEKIKKEESIFYSKMLEKTKEYIRNKKVEIRKISENNLSKKEELIEEDLIKQLENI